MGIPDRRPAGLIVPHVIFNVRDANIFVLSHDEEENYFFANERCLNLYKHVLEQNTQL